MHRLPNHIICIELSINLMAVGKVLTYGLLVSFPGQHERLLMPSCAGEGSTLVLFTIFLLD